MTKETNPTNRSTDTYRFDRGSRGREHVQLDIDIQKGYESAKQSLALVSNALERATNGFMVIGLDEAGKPKVDLGKNMPASRDYAEAHWDRIFDSFPTEVKDFVEGREASGDGNKFSPDFRPAIPALADTIRAANDDEILAQQFSGSGPDERIVVHNEPGRTWYSVDKPLSGGSFTDRGTPNNMEFNQGDLVAMNAADILSNARLAGLAIDQQPQQQAA